MKDRSVITNDNELTSLEANVLSDLAYGLAPAQIAAKRGLSLVLSECCVNEIYGKLGATSHQNLIAKAFIRGFIGESAFDAAVTASLALAERRAMSCFP
jgi:DNA-binding NarL/FixJ family response regulator